MMTHGVMPNRSPCIFCLKIQPLLNVHVTQCEYDTRAQRAVWSGCSTLTFFVSEGNTPPFIPRHFVKSTSFPSSDPCYCKVSLGAVRDRRVQSVTAHEGMCTPALCVCVGPTLCPYIFQTGSRLAVCVSMCRSAFVWSQRASVWELAMTYYCHSVDSHQNAAWMDEERGLLHRGCIVSAAVTKKHTK